MGSATHRQSSPQRPDLVARRDLRAAREHDRERTADVREAVYVRPLGRYRALVKNVCNDQAYPVANDSGRTFSPGSIVTLASNTGHPGERIIAGPPTASRGASRYSISASVLTGPVAPVESGCLAPLSGSYVGIHHNAGTDTLTAILYQNGTGQSVLAQKVYTGVFGTPSTGSYQRDHSFSGGDRVVFQAFAVGSGDVRRAVVTWDLDANTFAVCNTGSDRDPCIVIDGYVYAPYADSWNDGINDYTGVSMFELEVGETSFAAATDPIFRCGYQDSLFGSASFGAYPVILGDWGAAFQELLTDADGDRRFGLYDGTNGDPEWGPEISAVENLAHPGMPVFGTGYAASWGYITAQAGYGITLYDSTGEERVATPSAWNTVLAGLGPVHPSPSGGELTALVTHDSATKILRFAMPSWGSLPQSAQDGCDPPMYTVSAYNGLTPEAMLPRD